MDLLKILAHVECLLEALVEGYFRGDIYPEDAFGIATLALHKVKAMMGDKESQKILEEEDEESSRYPMNFPNDDEINRMLNKLLKLQKYLLETEEKRRDLIFICDTDSDNHSPTPDLRLV